MRIELDDTPQAVPVTFGQTLLRLLVGGVALLHGTQKLLQPAGFEASLAQLDLPEAHLLTVLVYSLELAAGVALLLGRFTRTAAFVLLCDAALGVALLYAVAEAPVSPLALEAPALLVGCCVLFLAVGSGPFGADHALRRRARMRAIAKDELWTRPPYVA